MRSPRSAALARRLALCVCALLVAAACGPGRDDADVEHARAANELARDLMSPFCPGRTLADCSSPDAGAVREEIRQALGAGESPEAVRARIEARFGDRVVGVPRERTGWLLPIAALVAGAGVLALVIRRALQPPVAAAPLPPEVERELARELDEVDPR
jgi:cytochrome c-type biogenesis protein CcmH/NrfF